MKLFLASFLIVFLQACTLRAQTCIEVDNEAELKQAHVDALKRTLLFKLHLSEVPKNPDVPLVVSQELQDEYNAVSTAQDLLSQKQTSCIEVPKQAPQFVVVPPTEVVLRCGYHGVLGTLLLYFCKMFIFRTSARQ